MAGEIAMIFHDVSVLISDELPIWPGDPGISVKLTSSLNRGDNANVSLIKMGVHTGTHIDAPFHFEPNGKTIDQLPIEVLIGPCRVIEVLHVNESIDLSVLKKLDLGGSVRILFKTRNSRWWENNETEFRKNFVYLSEEGARYLIEQGVKLVGIDYLSIEQFKTLNHETHHLLLRNQVIIIEGLNLSGVTEGEYELMALPLKLKGADGSPARVVLREETL